MQRLGEDQRCDVDRNRRHAPAQGTRQRGQRDGAGWAESANEARPNEDEDHPSAATDSDQSQLAVPGEMVEHSARIARRDVVLAFACGIAGTIVGLAIVASAS